MFLSMNVFMLPLPTLCRGKYLFHRVTPSESVTHEFYRQLYPNIIRDIDVSLRSACCDFYSCMKVGRLWVRRDRVRKKGGGRVEREGGMGERGESGRGRSDGGGTVGEREGGWKRIVEGKG